MFHTIKWNYRGANAHPLLVARYAQSIFIVWVLGSTRMNCYLFGSTYTTLDDLQPFASLAAPTEQTITAMNPNTDKTLRWKTHMPRRDLDEANMSLDEKNMNLDEKKPNLDEPQITIIFSTRKCKISTRKNEISTRKKRFSTARKQTFKMSVRSRSKCTVPSSLAKRKTNRT